MVTRSPGVTSTDGQHQHNVVVLVSSTTGALAPSAAHTPCSASLVVSDVDHSQPLPALISAGVATPPAGSLVHASYLTNSHAVGSSCADTELMSSSNGSSCVAMTDVVGVETLHEQRRAASSALISQPSRRTTAALRSTSEKKIAVSRTQHVNALVVMTVWLFFCACLHEMGMSRLK